jgi:hypothetical protein
LLLLYKMSKSGVPFTYFNTRLVAVQCPLALPWIWKWSSQRNSNQV